MVHLDSRTISELINISKPLMLQSIICRNTLVRINNQQLFNQINNRWRTNIEFLMVEMIVASRYLIENFISALPLKWEVTTHKYIKEHAKRPYVTFIVIMTFQYLRRHVVWSASNSLQFFIALGPLRETEIDQFDFALF